MAPIRLNTTLRGLAAVAAVIAGLAVPAAVYAQAPPGDSPATPPGAAKADPEQAGIRYKGVTLTPGGFIEAAMLYRSANENADIGSTFANVPYEGTANSHLSEFRGTARQSRLSLLVAGKVGDWKMSGFYEFDFLGAAPTANEVESNSFNIRQRQLWAQVETRSGFSFVAGQTWSLLTLNRQGLSPRSEWIPSTIDAQYVVGYNWARQWSARVTEKLGDRKVWLAASVENPETTLSVVNPPAGVFGLNTSPNATSPSSQIVVSSTPGANGVSTDVAPDVLAKIVFEPDRGHYEIKGLVRFFRDRVNGSNSTTAGGGIGFGAILPVTRRLDVIAQGLVGSGIGRYASGQTPDVTLDPDGAIIPIKAWHILAGFELHPSAKLDVYGYFGREQSDRADYLDAAGRGVGYGSPLNDNSACAVETPAAGQACQAQTMSLWQIQPGFWYRFHKGPEGTLQAGFSYSYTRKNTWPGAGGLAPVGRDHILMASFRYYIP